jgi:hypothetical protein
VGCFSFDQQKCSSLHAGFFQPTKMFVPCFSFNQQKMLTSCFSSNQQRSTKQNRKKPSTFLRDRFSLQKTQNSLRYNFFPDYTHLLINHNQSMIYHLPELLLFRYSLANMQIRLLSL